MPLKDPEARKQWQREYYQRTKEHHSEVGRAWTERNAAKVKADARAYYLKDIEKSKADRRAYYQANKEKVKAQARERYQRLKDDPEFKAKYAVYAAAHPEMGRESKRKWKRNNRHMVAEHAHQRRARLADNGPVEKIDRYEVWIRDNGCCYLCGGPADLKDWHLDHKTPIARGGTHTYQNVGVTHPSCNQKKNRLTEEEYRERLSSRKGWSH